MPSITCTRRRSRSSSVISGLANIPDIWRARCGGAQQRARRCCRALSCQLELFTLRQRCRRATAGACRIDTCAEDKKQTLAVPCNVFRARFRRRFLSSRVAARPACMHGFKFRALANKEHLQHACTCSCVALVSIESTEYRTQNTEYILAIVILYLVQLYCTLLVAVV